MATKLITQPDQDPFNTSFLRLDTIYTTGGGGGPKSAVTTTTVSGTKIEMTNNAGGPIIKFVSAPVSAGVTISGTITYNFWAKESAAAVNAGIRCELYRLSGGVETLISAKSFGSPTELTTTNAAKNWTDTTPTSTALAIGDRFVLHVYSINVGTMAAGTTTVQYAANTSTTGESYVTLTEAVTFQAYPFVAANTTFQTAGTSAVWNTSPIAGAFLLADIEWSDNVRTITSVTDDKSNTWVALASVVSWNASSRRSQLFYCKNAIAASVTVTVTFSSAPTSPLITLIEVRNIDTTNPIGGSNSGTGNSTSPNGGNVTTTFGTALIIGILATLDGSPVAGTGFELIQDGLSNSGQAQWEELGKTTTGTYSANFTQGSNQWIAWTVALKSTFQSFSTYDLTITETLSISESNTGLREGFNTLTETLSITESPVGNATFDKSISETFSISETSTGLMTFDKSIVETLTISESNTGLMIFDKTVTETLAVSETVIGNATFNRTISETLSINETPTGNLEMVVSATETLTVSDSTVGNITHNESINEALIISDSNLGNLDITISISETLTVTDTNVGNATFDKSINETITISESNTGNLEMAVNVSETLTVSDSESGNATFDKTNVETLVISESGTSLLEFSSMITDTLSVSDNAIANGTYNVFASDTIILTDAATLGSEFFLSATETLNISDNTSVTLILIDSMITESITFSDNISNILDTTSVVTENITLNVIASDNIEFTTMLIELITLSDSVFVGLIFDNTITESLTITDSASSNPATGFLLRRRRSI